MKTIIFISCFLLFSITNIYSQIWTTKGNNVFLADSIKKVGIGTSKPKEKLQVKGNALINDTLYVNKCLRVNNTMGDQIINISTDIGDKEVGFRLIRPTIQNHDWEIVNDGKLRINTSVDDFATVEDSIVTITYADKGRVGINITSPAYTLDVDGSIRALNGNVGIRTNPSSSYPLQVNGSIRAKEVMVQTGWSDYVFNKDYKLRSLNEVESYINKNKHLPDVPSASEVKTNGVKLGQMDSILTKKIEELTLYVIQLNNKMKEKDLQIEELRMQLKSIKH